MLKIELKPIGSNMNELHIGDNVILFSYSTPVAALVPGEGCLKTEIFHSDTTSRHISKWLDGIEAKKVPQEYIESLLIIRPDPDWAV